jgi:hypothetical protein
MPEVGAGGSTTRICVFDVVGIRLRIKPAVDDYHGSVGLNMVVLLLTGCTMRGLLAELSAHIPIKWLGSRSDIFCVIFMQDFF